MTESKRRVAGTGSDFPATDSESGTSSSSPLKLPPRLRRRLLESNKSPSTTVEEINAKLKEADLRRQQFYELLSSKARSSKPRTRSWSALQEEDLEAKLGQKGSMHDSIYGNLKMVVEQGEILSRKLASCWRCFAKIKGTTLALAKTYVALEMNEKSVKLMPFEQLALQIESATTLRTVKALFYRFENRITLKREASGTSNLSILVNIDHLLKHVASPYQRGTNSSARSSRVKKEGSSREVGCSPVKLSRYPVRVVLCAYMVSGHPDAVFSGKGEHEIALAEAAVSFIQEFELLIKIVLDGPIHTIKEQSASTNPTIVNFSHQLEAFDKAWCCYLYRFVVWKVKDAKLLEEDLMRAAGQLGLSIMQTSKQTSGGANVGLSRGTGAIQKQVSEDQKLSREKVLHLSGSAGLENMECSMSGMRSGFFEAKETPSLVASPNAPMSSASSPGSTDGSIVHGAEGINSQAEGCDKTGSLGQSLFKADDSSPRNKIAASSSRSSTEGYWSSGAMFAIDNEVLVNEIFHEDHHGLADGLGTSYEDQQSIKARVRETMERAFWDGIMETMKQDEPDYSWVLKLMKEVQDELCEISPSNWRQEIVETIDVDIFAQVLKSGIFDMDYFGRILEFALVTLQKLSASAYEDEMKTMHNMLLKELGEISQAGDKSSGSFAVLMIKGLRIVLQQIQTLKKEISKAQLRILAPFIKGPAGLEYLKKAFTNHYGSPTSAPDSLPLTVRWLSSVLVDSEHEWDEYVDSVSAFTSSDVRCSQGLPPTALRTGGSILTASTIGAPTSIATVYSAQGLEQPECKGEKVDLLLRLGLLKLVIEVEGLTIETVPETLKLNLFRLRTVQSQLQKIIVLSTSILILRQTLLGENLVTTPVDMENIVSQKIKLLSVLLDSVEDVGISEIVETLVGFSEGSDPQKLQVRKEVMANTLAKSLEAGGAVFSRISRTVYLAARGIVLGGSGVKGRQLAESALRRVGAALLTDALVEAVKVLVVVATVSASVHGAWYEKVLRHI